jgi:hypothetical protein
MDSFNPSIHQRTVPISVSSTSDTPPNSLLHPKSDFPSLMPLREATSGILKPQRFPDNKLMSTYRCMPRSTRMSAIDDKPLSDLSLIKLLKRRVKQNHKLSRTLMKAIKLASYEPQIDYNLCLDQFCNATHEPLDNPNPKEQRRDTVEIENIAACIIELVATSVDDETPRQYIRKAFMTLNDVVGQIYGSNEIMERVLGHERTMVRLCEAMRIVGVLWITHGGWPDHKLREDMLQYGRLYPTAGFDSVMEGLWGVILRGPGVRSMRLMMISRGGWMRTTRTSSRERDLRALRLREMWRSFRHQNCFFSRFTGVACLSFT